MHPRLVILIAGLALATATPGHSHPDPAHSLKELEAHLYASPDDVRLHVARAQIFRRLDHHDRAEEILTAAARRFPGDTSVRVEQARLDLARGNAASAFARVRAVLKNHPEEAIAWQVLGVLHQQAGETDSAIVAYRNYLQLAADPHAEDYALCASLLTCRAREGDPLDALRILDEGLARLGCLTGLQLMAIETDLALGRHDSALARYDTLSSRFHPRPDWSLQRARILVSANRRAEAAAAYDAVIALIDTLPPEKRAHAEARRMRREAADGRASCSS